jgi:hypothetical protein
MFDDPHNGSGWCLRQPMSGGPAEIIVDEPASAADTVRRNPAIDNTDRTANAIAVAPGLGGLYAAGRFGQGAGAMLFLITDTGVKYPVASTDAAERLGYYAEPGPCPPELLDLLPTGPSLGP